MLTRLSRDETPKESPKETPYETPKTSPKETPLSGGEVQQGVRPAGGAR